MPTCSANPIGPSREQHLQGTLGSASISLGLAYLMTSYVPIAENQFLHASVPIRLLTSVLLGAKCWNERGTMSERGRKEFLWVAAYDGGAESDSGLVAGTVGWESCRYLVFLSGAVSNPDRLWLRRVL